MLLPLSWLNELIPQLEQTLPQSELEPTFARMGLPLEGISEIPGIPQGVLFGTVTFCTPIPETHLFALEVDLGSESRSIVTGAPNSRAGVGVAVVPPGMTLNGVTLGVRQMQGIESWGMAASPLELGVGEYGGGLLLLPLETAAPGTDLSHLWAADSVLDVEITPNRADVLSALGVARDLAAYLKLELKLPPEGLQADSNAQTSLQIHILEETRYPVRGDPSEIPRSGCDFFVARAASGLKNGPSPLWIQRRLLLCGQRPINLIVDSSNYTMFELGQPTAFYDARDLPDRALYVTTAAKGEVVRTLDEAEYALEPGDLTIRTGVQDGTGHNIVGIGGVKGGFLGRIREDSSEIVLEAAHFDPIMIRQTSTRLGLKTDAAYRYERGVNPELPLKAANRIMGLLEQYGGAQIEAGYARSGEPFKLPAISLDTEYCCRLLGMDIPDEEMVDILERLGCEVVSKPGALQVSPPAWRVDMNIPEDLIEEVGRLHGYHELPETLPYFLEHPDNIGADAYTRHRSSIKVALCGLGFSEVVNYSFTSLEESSSARAPRPTLELRNPLTAERTHMRTALHPSLLNSARVNSSEKSLLLFELGRIFPQSGEFERLGVLMRGDLVSSSWMKGLAGGFYVFKGLLESFAETLGGNFQVQGYVEGFALPHLHPGICGKVLWNGLEKGTIGAVHPAVAQSWGLKGDLYLCELDLPLMAQEWSFADPSRQPAALRDLAIIAPLERSYFDLETLIKLGSGPLLEGIEVFDVYAGDPIPAGFRSVAVRLSYRSSTRTLTDEEVGAEFGALIARVKAEGLSIRES
ncbi:MAG: phenylalanine--tRNA ligase subunit beta [Pseudopedobacter sp.]|nr:phenylalanine--tRNA ligase subunit beta [Deinococcales bacterium]